MMGAQQVALIVLNWNGRADTLACLESVSRIPGGAHRVIVADNGSSDGSVAAIRQAFPLVELIENAANLGYAGGNNTAIRHALDAGAEFVLLLNNDTIVDPGIVEAFVDAARRMPQAGVFGAKIYFHADPQRLWYAGGYWDAKTLSFNEHGAGQLDRGQYDQLTETEWVIGCAMFVRAEVFREVGLLEPSFFLNNEEVDFCSRVRRAGYTCAYVPQARLWHKVSVSFGGEDSPLKEYFSARNRLLWAQRNAPAGVRWRIYVRSASGLMRRYGRALLGCTVTGALTPKSWWWAVRAAFADPRNRAAAMGLRDFWLRRFGDCPAEVRALARQWAARQAQRAAPVASQPG
ncbi:MAG: glycosyltransferase family 2 protein [Actinobacteria bacterium]|nr:glycosyltransferase family 2 protein [Actinomycetota bacterium]